MTQQTQSRVAKKAEGGLLETIKVIIQALLIAIVVRTFLFQPFNIPSGSLIPTLLVGDYLFVSKYTYGYSRYSFPFSNYFPVNLLPSGRVLASMPKRGDIVVFKVPYDNETDFIKRVIGLPGDHIQMTDGRLYINGTIVPREPTTPVVTADAYGQPAQMPTYIETLPGGVKHQIIEVNGDHGYLDTTSEYVVPEGHYFMMGDNRDNSTDSRVPTNQKGVGYVPFENLVGRAEIIFFSIDGGPERSSGASGLVGFVQGFGNLKIRWDRIFQRVK